LRLHHHHNANVSAVPIISHFTSGCSNLFGQTVSEILGRNIPIMKWIPSYLNMRDEFLRESGSKVIRRFGFEF
jgi:hypothetical protein